MSWQLIGLIVLVSFVLAIVSTAANHLTTKPQLPIYKSRWYSVVRVGAKAKILRVDAMDTWRTFSQRARRVLGAVPMCWVMNGDDGRVYGVSLADHTFDHFKTAVAYDDVKYLQAQFW